MRAVDESYKDPARTHRTIVRTRQQATGKRAERLREMQTLAQDVGGLNECLAT